MMLISTSPSKPVAIALLLKTLLLLTCYGWLSPALAELDATHTASVIKSLPDEIASSIGPWRDREAWRDLGVPEIVPGSDTSNTSIATPFKPAESLWWDVLDTASFIAVSIGVAKPYGASSKPYQSQRPVNSPVPPK